MMMTGGAQRHGPEALGVREGLVQILSNLQRLGRSSAADDATRLRTPSTNAGPSQQ